MWWSFPAPDAKESVSAISMDNDEAGKKVSVLAVSTPESTDSVRAFFSKAE